MFQLRVLSLLLLPSLSLAQAPLPGTASAPAAPAEAHGDAAPPPAAQAERAPATDTQIAAALPTWKDLAALDALHLQRDQPASLAKLEAALEEGLKAEPKAFELLWRKAQLRWTQADLTQGEAKKKLGQEAWTLGEQAIQAAPQRVEGHYWAAVGLGAYSQAVGILAALTQGLEGKFNGHLDRAIALAPGYNDGAPVSAKGRYFFELPWPKRNLDKAVELLTQVTRKHPRNLRAWLFLAEAELDRNQPQAAQAALEQVLKGSIAFDPPEGRHSKALARKFQPKVQERLK